MPAVLPQEKTGYRGPMVIPRRPRKRQQTAVRLGGKIVRKNRIHELWKARGWTAADVAERVRAIAEQRGDVERMKTANETISRLSTGAMTLDQDWMELLGEVYNVPAGEIISPPAAEGMRRVEVKLAFEADAWRGPNAPSDHYSILIPDDPALRDVELYAAEVRGPAMNARYPAGTLLILSPILQKPGEIAEGRRYHVRAKRGGECEDTVKTLVRRDDQYWLAPESTSPAHQAWQPLDGSRLGVELIGRVRGVYLSEE